MPDSLLLRLAQRVVIYARDVDGAASIARHVVRSGGPADVRVAGHLLLVFLETARGRPRAAEQQLAAAGSLNPGAALAYRARLANLHFLPVSAARIRALRDALAAWRGGGTENPHFSLYSGLQDRERQYLLALLSAQLGDRAAVERHLLEMQSFAPENPNPNRIPRHLLRAASVRARLAAQVGDTAAALRLLEERYKSTPEAPFASVNYLQRHLRPDLLRALGREQEAFRWYGAVPWTGSGYDEDALWDIVHLAPFHFGQAQLLERTGRRREAAQHYRRVVELWKDADPELRPTVDHARQRLAQLR